jgi:glycosyltransferase involved in cell wall biosynthesis
MLSVALINVPLRLMGGSTGPWITVPPQGYGGIQWVVAHLLDGLLARGHRVFLLGAPGSPCTHSNLEVVDAAEPDDMARWLRSARIDVVHDHSNGVVDLSALGRPFVSTHHLTGAPRIRRNCVYLSHAQRAQAQRPAAPVIRIPVNPSRYLYASEKQDYLLTLTRVSAWKGAREAALFAAAAGVPLRIAGPAWEPDYLAATLAANPGATYLGEVGGEARLRLLREARGVLVLSQPVEGPWGSRWCEPGATVVSEAAVSGTPVIATDNGCLPEIVPGVGRLVRSGGDFSTEEARVALLDLPRADQLQRRAIEAWGHVKIAAEWEQLYREVIDGRSWE